MIIVKVQGGIGNQLFQASQLFTELSGQNERIILHTRPLKSYRVKHAIFDPAWSIFKTTELNSGWVRLLLKLDQFLISQRLLNFFNVKCVQGYFQDGYSIEFAKLVLKSIEKRAVAQESSYSHVIHCRGGDYLEPPNDKIYWQIKFDDYVSEIGGKLSTEWAVIGNHKTFSEAFRSAGADSISGTEEEDLMLMAATDHVICSNSTFACWGAIFCLLNNGMVSAPSRYFVESKTGPNPFKALAEKFPTRVNFFGALDA